MLYLLENNEDTEAEIRDAAATMQRDVAMFEQMLGETICEMEGQRVFEMIKSLRQLEAKGERANLKKILETLSDDDMNLVTSASGYYSTLANVVEDHHHIRRWRMRRIRQRRIW